MYYKYDSLNRIYESKLNLNGIGIKTGFVYANSANTAQKPNLIYGVTLNGSEKLNYRYDNFNRLNTRILNTTTPFVTKYGYLEGASSNETTTLVKTVKNGNTVLEYAYDELGNITSIKKNGVVIESYEYDALNQLTKVTNSSGVYVYTYDNGGNILSVTKDGQIIKTYQYANNSFCNPDWKDLLTSYNGQDIAYDNIGNPYAYRGYILNWQNGRELYSIAGSNYVLAYYAYDGEGNRISKTVGGVTTDFYWLNGILQGQKTGDEHIVFLYDENGTAYGMLVKNGATENYYYYVFNLQGDVIGILDSDGNEVVQYTYDVWGDLLSITGTLADTIGQKNPIRYRGYYYDNESGYYYLQSRYYDPEVGRFINADSYISTGQGILGTNMFAYCGNNPVNMYDPTGEVALSVILGKMTAVVIGTFVLGVATHAITNSLVKYPLVLPSFSSPITLIDPKIESKEKDKTITVPNKPKGSVTFPVNPLTFNPVGLVMVPRAGTKNGEIISWMDPFTNTEVFRWDENPNFSNGAHYHIRGTGHYYPGSVIPEPYAKIYFPFR